LAKLHFAHELLQTTKVVRKTPQAKYPRNIKVLKSTKDKNEANN